MSKITRINTINNIPIYANPHMEKGNFMIVYKGAEVLEPGYLFVPIDIWNEGMETAEGFPIEKDEVDRILKMKRDRKLSDVKGIICNCPEEDIDKIIQSLYKQFK